MSKSKYLRVNELVAKAYYDVVDNGVDENEQLYAIYHMPPSRGIVNHMVPLGNVNFSLCGRLSSHFKK